LEVREGPLVRRVGLDKAGYEDVGIKKSLTIRPAR
jgi:hypothetical protein